MKRGQRVQLAIIGVQKSIRNAPLLFVGRASVFRIQYRAPFVVSIYDAATGEIVPTAQQKELSPVGGRGEQGSRPGHKFVFVQRGLVTVGRAVPDIFHVPHRDDHARHDQPKRIDFARVRFTKGIVEVQRLSIFARGIILGHV